MFTALNRIYPKLTYTGTSSHRNLSLSRINCTNELVDEITSIILVCLRLHVTYESVNYAIWKKNNWFEKMSNLTHNLQCEKNHIFVAKIELIGVLALGHF